MRQYNDNPPLLKRDRPLAKQPQITSTEEGYKTKLHLSLEGENTTSTSTKEGATQQRKGLQQMVYLNHKPTSFSHKRMILNR